MKAHGAEAMRLRSAVLLAKCAAENMMLAVSSRWEDLNTTNHPTWLKGGECVLAYALGNTSCLLAHPVPIDCWWDYMRGVTGASSWGN